MYGRRANDEGLSQTELEAARLGFSQLLRRKRFSPQFISRHADELFAQATLEYSRKLAEGVEIENPPGWMIECAWRRTKSLLEAEDRRPREVSTEKSGPIADEPGGDPAELLLDEERFRKIWAAVEELSADQRRLLALAYFEGMPIREAARQLRWHASKAQRAHEGAQRRLHELLGVQSSDELQLEVGLAAYLSLVAGNATRLHLPARLEPAADAVGRGAAHLWARVQELARRFVVGGGGEPTSAAVGGNAGRAAGVCAAAALACLAGGVVGPGVDGLLESGSHGVSAARHQPIAAASNRELGTQGAGASSPEPATQGGAAGTAERPTQSASPAAESGGGRAERAASSQFGVESAAGQAQASSAPAGTASASEAVAPNSSGGAASASNSTPTKTANAQFAP